MMLEERKDLDNARAAERAAERAKRLAKIRGEDGFAAAHMKMNEEEKNKKGFPDNFAGDRVKPDIRARRESVAALIETFATGITRDQIQEVITKANDNDFTWLRSQGRFHSVRQGNTYLFMPGPKREPVPEPIVESVEINTYDEALAHRNWCRNRGMTPQDVAASVGEDLPAATWTGVVALLQREARKMRRSVGGLPSPPEGVE